MIEKTSETTGDYAPKSWEVEKMSKKANVIGVAPGEVSKIPDDRKKTKKTSKDAIRKTLLARLPKGGIAVEIGVWHGDFSPIILDIVKPDRLFLIDPWEHIEVDSHSNAFVGRTKDDKMEDIFQKVRKRFEKEIEAERVSIIRDYSVPALKLFDDESISFAYIDGDHSYEGVSADLKTIFPKIKFGGIIAFDDYHRRGWWKDGVIRAVNEFVGTHARQVRIRAIAGAQIAIEKIRPVADS